MLSVIVTLARRWRTIGVVALVAAIAALAALDGVHVRQRDAALAATAVEQVAHKLTVANYTAAAAIAARRDTENVGRVVAAQRAITERITDDYQDRLADGDARYQRLRDQAAAYSRGAGAADLSAAREATCRAYANAPCDDLPALLKAAQDNADQLVALIAWTQAQAEVPVTVDDAPVS